MATSVCWGGGGKLEVSAAHDGNHVLGRCQLDWQQLGLHLAHLPSENQLYVNLLAPEGQKHCPIALHVSLHAGVAETPHALPAAHTEAAPTAVLRSQPSSGNEGALTSSRQPEADGADGADNTASAASRLTNEEASLAVEEGIPPLQRLPFNPGARAALDLLRLPTGNRRFSLSLDLHQLTRSLAHPQQQRVTCAALVPFSNLPLTALVPAPLPSPCRL